MAKVIFEVNKLQNYDLIGRVVISLAGRDKDSKYVVIKHIDDQYILVANGSTKTIEMPKKKKIKHLMLTTVINYDIKNYILSQNKNTNLLIKRFIKLNGTVKEVWLPYVKRWYNRNGR